MFIVLFNLLVGLFQVSSENKAEGVDISKEFLTNNIKQQILDTPLGQNKIIGGTIQILSLPFLILESLIFVLAIIGTGFIILPPIIELLIFTPLGIMIIIDYVLPMIRGN